MMFTRQCKYGITSGLAAAYLIGSLSQGFAQNMGDMIHDRTLVLGNEQVQTVSAGRNVTLNGTQVLGNVMAGREVEGSNCSIQGSLMAGRDVQLSNCSSVAAVSAGRALNLSNTTVNGNVSAGTAMTLSGATIHGNASAGGEVSLRNTRIDQTLSATVPRLVLDSTTVDSIKLGAPSTALNNGVFISSNNNSHVITNNSVITSGNGIVINGRSGNNLVTVGPGSLSNVNGYTVKSSATQTTVITPDGSVYVNGSKVSGDGPASYSEYRTQFTQAPNVHGPGWSDDGVSTRNPEEMGAAMAEQVVELTNNSVVTGNITFEGGRGRVIVHNGSRFEGTVEGGTVQRN